MTRSTSNINQNGIFSSGIEAVKTLKTVFILEEQRSVKIESAVPEAQNSTSHSELNYKWFFFGLFVSVVLFVCLMNFSSPSQPSL